MIERRARLITLLTLRVGLGAVFCFSALAKLDRPFDFLIDVYQYQLTGPRLGLAVATLLPQLELLCGLALITSVAARAASWIILGLMILFIAAQTAALARGLHIACGCFGGEAEALIGPASLGRTGLLTVIAAILIWLGTPTKIRGPDSQSSDAPAAPRSTKT
jgi:uncharacterized membrane protein YphA (DoxX/SURF4 family)